MDIYLDLWENENVLRERLEPINRNENPYGTIRATIDPELKYNIVLMRAEYFVLCVRDFKGMYGGEGRKTSLQQLDRPPEERALW